MKKIIRNKKGNWADVFEYTRVAIGIGIVLLFVFLILTNLDTGFDNAASQGGIMNDSQALGISETVKNKFPTITDFYIPLIYIVFLAFSAWSARKIESSHLLTILGVIMIIITFLFAMVAENIWEAFKNQTTMTTLVTSFPITNFFLSQLRFFVLIYAAIVAVSLYAKTE